MVVAALLRNVMNKNVCCCCCSTQYNIVSCNPLYVPVNKQGRMEFRRREFNIWLASTADDLDLISDWWFWWSQYTLMGTTSLTSNSLLFWLFIFCCAGTFTWFLELVQVAFVRPDKGWIWLPTFIILIEDIPQVVLTVLIRGGITNLSSLGVFNVMTSLYSLSIRVAGELFMHCCYCCEPVDGGNDEEKPDNTGSSGVAVPY